MKKQQIKINRSLPAGLLAVAVLAAKHYGDVCSGAQESGDLWLRQHYVMLAAVAAAVLLGAGILFFGGRIGQFKRKPAGLEVVCAAAVLGLGLTYLFVLPPLSAPDEVSHYISAYQLSSRMLGRPANYRTGHVLVRAGDWFLEDMDGTYRFETDEDGYLVIDSDGVNEARVFGQTLTEETYRVIHEKGPDFLAGSGSGLAVSVYPPVVTTPLVYLPQALGMALARLLGLGSLGLVYLGRLFNLLFFAAVTSLAMRRLPFGKEVLFGVCLLPMSLHLAASLSYDSVIMAGIFLFTAWCLSLAFEKERVKLTDVLVLAGIMAVVGPCKMVYAVFMGLCLLIPVKKFGSRKRWAVSAALVFGAWAVMMAAVNSRTIATYAAETDSFVPWAEEAGYSLSLLLHNPGLLLNMFYNTILWQSQHYHLTMIGAYLGNLDVILDVPYLLVVFFTCSLVLLALRKPGESLLLTGGRRIWIWTLCAGCTAALMLSMLIAWTPLSAVVIAGVQGRYFLPFLPVFLMTVKNDLITLTKNVDRSILYLMCCANGYIVLRLFSIVCLRL